jgi:hypothetical protein
MIVFDTFFVLLNYVIHLDIRKNLEGNNIMQAAIKKKSFPLTPTTAYFFAKLTLLVNDQTLRQYEMAAQEFIRSEKLPSEETPCDAYFTSHRGCVVFDDELEDIIPDGARNCVSPPSMTDGEKKISTGFMAANMMKNRHLREAITYIQKYIPDELSEDEKKSWIERMQRCIDPYLKRREEKYNQFSDHVIRYITDGTLLGRKNETNLIHTFHKLEESEKNQLTGRIIETLLDLTNKVKANYANRSLCNKVTSFFYSDPSYWIAEQTMRANDFVSIKQTHQKKL